MRYVASCSFGKDSLATILLARKHGEPLDEAVYCEVMFDKTISGEVPEHRDFIYTKGIPALEKMGISTHISGQYDALKLTVLNRINGPVDIQVLKLGDILGKKPIPGNPNFREGVAPHIWDNYGKFEWYAYRPTEADYETVRQAVGRYLDVFRDRTLERTRNGPKLVYICAPLRGDVEQNITFAKEKAREVFQAGDIPICPHLMFPPFADPDDPVQDQAAREMGLRLVEHCQQVNVYGPVRTPGMLAEIRRAEELRIPVKADQPGLQKTKGRPRRGQSR